MQQRVLIVGDHGIDQALLESCAARVGAECVSVKSLNEAVDFLTAEGALVAVVALSCVDEEGLAALVRVRRANSGLFVVTVGGDAPLRMRVLDTGIDVALPAPVDEPCLRSILDAAVRFAKRTAVLAAKEETIRSMRTERRDLFGSIVHDLKNPLSVVLGNLEWVSELQMAASESNRSEPISEALSDAISGAQRLKSLVDTLLLISQMDGPSLLRQDHVLLDPLIEEVVRRHMPAARQRDISFSVDIEPGLDVEGNVELLRRAVDNLVESSLRKTPSSGRCDLRARASSDIEIEVVNSMLPGRNESSNDARVGSAKSSAPPMGLGLYFLKQAIEVHQGAVDLSRSEPTSRRVVVRLPSYAAPTPSERSPLCVGGRGAR